MNRRKKTRKNGCMQWFLWFLGVVMLLTAFGRTLGLFPDADAQPAPIQIVVPKSTAP